MSVEKASSVDLVFVITSLSTFHGQYQNTANQIATSIIVSNFFEGFPLVTTSFSAAHVRSQSEYIEEIDSHGKTRDYVH
jgi:hypothetical protein